jgi:sphinganine C4-monooxygenase
MFANISFPFYYSQKPDLIHGVPDYILALASPVIAYWCLSVCFHALDISGWKWLEKYRIHDSEEVQARNLATRSEVVWTVVLQQVIQTALGIISLSDKSTHVVNHVQQLRRVASFLDSVAFTTFGEHITPQILVHAARFLYCGEYPYFSSWVRCMDSITSDALKLLTLVNF